MEISSESIESKFFNQENCDFSFVFATKATSAVYSHLFMAGVVTMEFLNIVTIDVLKIVFVIMQYKMSVDTCYSTKNNWTHLFYYC